MKIYAHGITHGGIFHADDVFATAMLQLLAPDFTVTRLPSVSTPAADTIVYDIGGGTFDHHTSSVPTRANGIPYAAFGLLWKEYGTLLCGSAAIAERIEQSLVIPIDLADNGGTRNPISDLISAMNPAWNSSETATHAFLAAVDFARTSLQTMIAREQADALATAAVEEALAQMKDHIVVFQRYLPWHSILPASDALFVVYPSARGGWNVQSVPHPNTHEAKLLFPQAWRGKNAEEILVLSDIPITFCHIGGFLCATDSLPHAIAAAQFAQRVDNK